MASYQRERSRGGARSPSPEGQGRGMRWLRAWTAFCLVLLTFLPAATALAEHGRPHLTWLDREERQEKKPNQDSDQAVITAFNVAARGLTGLDKLIGLGGGDGRISGWDLFSTFAQYGFNTSVPLLGEEVAGWTDVAGQAGDGFSKLVSHYRAGLVEASKLATIAGKSPWSARLGLFAGALRFGAKNALRFGDFVQALHPSNMIKAINPSQGVSMTTAATRSLGLLGAAWGAIQGTLTVVGAVRDRGDKLERLIRGAGGVLTIVGSVALAASLVAAAPAVAAGAAAVSLVAGTTGAILSQRRVSAWLADKVRPAISGLASRGRAALHSIGAGMGRAATRVRTAVAGLGQAATRLRTAAKDSLRRAMAVTRWAVATGRRAVQRFGRAVGGAAEAIRHPARTARTVSSAIRQGIKGALAAVRNPRKTLRQAQQSMQWTVQSTGQRVVAAGQSLKKAVNSFLGRVRGRKDRKAQTDP